MLWSRQFPKFGGFQVARTDEVLEVMAGQPDNTMCKLLREQTFYPSLCLDFQRDICKHKID